jgi:putative flippase GtrA
MKTNNSQDRSKFFRFVIAGLLNTVFGFAVFSGAILAGAAIWIAVLAGMILGTIFNFITTGGYVFRDLTARRIPRFLAFYLLTFITNLTLIGYLTEFLNNAILAQAILTPPIALLSYYFMSTYVFPRKNDRT